MSHDSLLRNDPETLESCRDWEEFSTKFFITYQKQALRELDYKGEELNFSEPLHKFRKSKKILNK